MPPRPRPVPLWVLLVALVALVALADTTSVQRADGQTPNPGPSSVADGRPQLDSTTAAAIDRIVARTAAAGLPTDVLQAKALEGASRRAPPARIVHVVSAYADALAVGRDALGSGADDAELVAAAGTIVAGVSRDALATLAATARRTRPGVRLTVPLVVAADLVARGVPPAAAADAVRALAAGHTDDSDFWRLREQIATDIDMGTPPLQAALLRTDAGVLAPPPPPPSAPAPPTPGAPR
jgi:hypothetical protein